MPFDNYPNPSHMPRFDHTYVIYYGNCQTLHWLDHTYKALNDVDYTLLQNKKESWYCIFCTEEIFPFCHIEKKEK